MIVVRASFAFIEGIASRCLQLEIIYKIVQ